MGYFPEIDIVFNLKRKTWSSSFKKKGGHLQFSKNYFALPILSNWVEKWCKIKISS